MPRYLSFHVSGDAAHITDRTQRALKRIGKVKDFDPETQEISGVIRIDGEPAQIKATWKLDANDKKSRFLMDLEADSSDRLSEAADRALYAFARAYKSAAEEEDADSSPSKKPLFITTLVVVMISILIFLFGRHQ